MQKKRNSSHDATNSTHNENHIDSRNLDKNLHQLPWHQRSFIMRDNGADKLKRWVEYFTFLQMATEEDKDLT